MMYSIGNVGREGREGTLSAGTEHNLLELGLNETLSGREKNHRESKWPTDSKGFLRSSKKRGC
jgi:hypothetical protein